MSEEKKLEAAQRLIYIAKYYLEHGAQSATVEDLVQSDFLDTFENHEQAGSYAITKNHDESFGTFENREDMENDRSVPGTQSDIVEGLVQSDVLDTPENDEQAGSFATNKNLDDSFGNFKNRENDFEDMENDRSVPGT